MSYKLIQDDPKPECKGKAIDPAGTLIEYSLVDMCRHAKKVDAWYKRRFKHYKRNNTLMLYFDYPYEVDLDRINNAEQLLDWVLHLMGKVWFDKQDAREFASRVAEIKGWTDPNKL